MTNFIITGFLWISKEKSHLEYSLHFYQPLHLNNHKTLETEKRKAQFNPEYGHSNITVGYQINISKSLIV